MKLYYSPGACSLAPHVALREVGANFELARVNVREAENNSAEYLRINPRARVPALEADGRIYTEAPALLVYIASLKPESGLLPPPGSAELARALEWLAWFNSSLHIAYAQLWRPERFLPEGADTEALVGEGRATIQRMNGEVEERLVGPWLLGERYSLADVYALPFYRWGNRIGLEMAEAYPRWTGVTERTLARPEVTSALAAEGLTIAEFLPV